MIIKKIIISFIGWTILLSCSNNSAVHIKEISPDSFLPFNSGDRIYSDPENPLSFEKINFGRYLFYDRRLSVNQTKSCASCHDQKFSFTDSYRRSVGAFGGLHQRNSSPLINLFLKKYLTESDSSVHFPLQQIKNPLFHNDPVELGWKQNETKIIPRILSDSFYQARFSSFLVKNDIQKTSAQIKKCISSFVISITSLSAPFDNYFYLHTGTLTNSEQAGMKLFYSDSLSCFKCHSGANFDTPLLTGEDGQTLYYFNTGLYNLGRDGSFPEYDPGLFEFTGNRKDMGKYRVPTLRNLAFTAPYYHDGSAATLEEVIKDYEAGGRNITTGIYKGDGRQNPQKNKLISGFSLTSQQRSDLVNFLLSLSDSSILTNKNYSNPFTKDETH